jgi:uncharacterized protein YyaL (SSP411 family)
MANRLARSASPYLLQHKDNPVDWWEWGDDAFAEARARDVPVLLSVGYAACHWCHVMAHESFEDPATADVMNRLFVNVKVDREERPDVDAIYMEAVQAMTGHGGWPMTVFLDHEGRPFFAGTYFPGAPRHGMPAFTQVLTAVSDAWAGRRSDVAEQAGRLVSAISGDIPAGDLPDESALEAAYRTIARSYDPVHGGFGGAPKFPQQPVLELVLRLRRRPWADGADEMLATTLDRMAAGGIHDQVGGGFARYSVDATWLVPHFEKMLYDNAQLARIYLWAGVELGRPDLLDVSRRTLDYLSRYLTHADGGLLSSEDADSEGEEGKFYLWTIDEVRGVLGPDADLAIEGFGLSEEGNFEGSNILTATGGVPESELGPLRERLREARDMRVRPGLDDKVVTAWNGLAIRTFAEAGSALGDEGLLGSARRAAEFVLAHLVVEGRLMRSWREGRVSVPGFLDDHASMALGLFSLYAATAEERWYREAMGLTDRLDDFARPAGGYYATGDDRGGMLIKRPFDFTDNPHPSGNALAAEALFLAGLYTGSNRPGVDGALASAAVVMERHPSMVAHHLSVLDATTRSRELAIVGPGWRDLAAVHHARFRPQVALAPSPGGTTTVPLLEGRPPGDPALAYVCRDFVCDLPTSDGEELARLLD